MLIIKHQRVDNFINVNLDENLDVFTFSQSVFLSPTDGYEIKELLHPTGNRTNLPSEYRLRYNQTDNDRPQ